MPGPRTPRDQSALYVLVLRCQTGDNSAFTRVMEMFKARTLGHLKSIVGDDAEDLQQEVWFTVYRNLRHLSNPGAFRTWLFQTTRHRAIDFLRRRNRLLEFVDNTTETASGNPLPDESFADFDQSVVQSAMAALSPIHREALLFRYQEELSYAEIAVVTGCSIGTVRSRIHHAKRNLRDALELQRVGKAKYSERRENE